MLTKLFWLGLLAAITAYIFQAILVLNIGRRVYNHRPGVCKQLEGIENGAEDITVVESEDLAFITSGVYYMADRPNVEGNIFLYDFNVHKTTPLKLPINGMQDRATFHPHGISYWIVGNRIRLFVISHQPPAFTHTVEVFDYDKKAKALQYVKTIKDEKFVRPNNIVALSEKSFFISNDGTSQTELMNTLEIMAFYKGGSVVYYDGDHSHWVAQGQTSPNGIAIVPSTKTLLVSHVNSKSIGIYNYSTDFKSITKVAMHDIGTAADNLWVDSKGGVWTAGHPVLHETTGHLGEPDNFEIYAPSHVLHMKFSPDWQKMDITEIFADDGRFISASAVAVQHKGRLLIGSVYRQGVVCENLM